MGTRNWVVAAFTATTLATIAACSAGDSLNGPKRVDAPSHLLGGIIQTTEEITESTTSLLIAPLKRTAPLGNDVTWSFTVGSGGGSSSDSTVGLTVKIPAGALSSPTTITVTALKGSAVAYGFQPHGLVFAKNAFLTQNLRGTEAGGLLSIPLLSGAHFATETLQLNSDGLAVVTEIVPALTDLLSQKVTFGIGHFSGWIVATGRSETEEASEGQ